MRPEGVRVLRKGLRDDQEPRHKTRKVRTQESRRAEEKSFESFGMGYLSTDDE